MHDRVAVQESLTRQMGFLFIGRLGAFVLTFATPLVLVRVFSQEEFGLYRQLFLICGTLLSILTFGFSASLSYFLPREPHERHVYVSQTLLAFTGLGIFGASILIAFKSSVALILNNSGLEDYLPYLAAFVLLSLITSVFEPLMISVKDVKLASVTSFFSELLRATLIVGASILTHSMLILIVALGVWGGCRLVGLLVYLHKLKIPCCLWPQREHFGAQFRYAFPFGLAVIARSLADTVHQYVVSYLYNPTLFAIYSVGCLQIPVVSIAFESVSEVTLVRLTELGKKGMLEEASRLIGDAVIKLCLIYLPLYVWLMVSARDLILLLYTQRFEASAGIFMIFLAIIPLTAVGLDYVPRAFADTGFVLKVNIVRLFLTTVLMLALIRPLGPVGAVLSMILAMGMTKVMILLRVMTLLKVSLRQLLPWRRLGSIVAASLMAGIVAWMVQFTWLFSVGTSLFLSGVVFGLCYGVMIWNIGVFNSTEKHRLMEIVQRVAKTTNSVFFSKSNVH